MPTWYDAFGAEYNARNWNHTDQSQNNPSIAAGGHFAPGDGNNDHGSARRQHADDHSDGHSAHFYFGGHAANHNEAHHHHGDRTAVADGHVGPGDVHNHHGSAAWRHADTRSDGHLAPDFGSHAANHNETHQHQSNPTAVFGEDIGSVEVHNNQSNVTLVDANAGSGGYHLPGFQGFGVEVINFNVTTQVQADPTIVVGDHFGPVDVDNSQSNLTIQEANAGSGGYHLPDLPGFGIEVINFNITTQVQADPTIVVGDHFGSVDVNNSQSNVAEQFAFADQHLIV